MKNLISFQFSLAVEADESKAPALLGPVVLGDVDVADSPVLLKQAYKQAYVLFNISHSI